MIGNERYAKHSLLRRREDASPTELFRGQLVRRWCRRETRRPRYRLKCFICSHKLFLLTCLHSYTKCSKLFVYHDFMQCRQNAFAYTLLAHSLHPIIPWKRAYFSASCWNYPMVLLKLSYGAVEIILWCCKNYPMEQKFLFQGIIFKWVMPITLPISFNRHRAQAVLEKCKQSVASRITQCAGNQLINSIRM